MNVGPTRSPALGSSMSAPYGKGSWHQTLSGSICSLLINSHRNSQVPRDLYLTRYNEETDKNSPDYQRDHPASTTLSSTTAKPHKTLQQPQESKQFCSAVISRSLILWSQHSGHVIWKKTWTCNLKTLVITSRLWFCDLKNMDVIWILWLWDLKTLILWHQYPGFVISRLWSCGLNTLVLWSQDSDLVAINTLVVWSQDSDLVASILWFCDLKTRILWPQYSGSVISRLGSCGLNTLVVWSQDSDLVASILWFCDLKNLVVNS